MKLLVNESLDSPVVQFREARFDVVYRLGSCHASFDGSVYEDRSGFSGCCAPCQGSTSKVACSWCTFLSLIGCHGLKPVAIDISAIARRYESIQLPRLLRRGINQQYENAPTHHLDYQIFSDIKKSNRNFEVLQEHLIEFSAFISCDYKNRIRIRRLL